MGAVPGAAASLQCRREVLSSQPASFVAIPAQCHRPSQAGPRPGSQLSMPKPCRLENSGPSMGPGRRRKQTGRKKERLSFGDPAVRRLCDPRLVCCPLWATVSIT